MGLTEKFISEADAALSSDFLEHGYIIRPVDDREALDALRREVTGLVAAQLGQDMPNDPDAFLNNIHRHVAVPALNPLRLAVYRAMNGKPW